MNFYQKIIIFHLSQMKNKFIIFFNHHNTKCWQKELIMTVYKLRKVHIPTRLVEVILPHQFWRKKLVSSTIQILKILRLQIQINLKIIIRIQNYNIVLVKIGSTLNFWKKNIKKQKFHQTENIYMKKIRFQIYLKHRFPQSIKITQKINYALCALLITHQYLIRICKVDQKFNTTTCLT